MDFWQSIEAETFEWGVVIGASLAAALWFDVRTGRIPNLLTLPLFVAGVVYSCWQEGVGGFGAALAGAIIMSFPYMLAFVLGSCGAGDAKLMAGVGAWLGIREAVVAVLCVSAVGLLMAVVKTLIAWRVRDVKNDLLLKFNNFWLWLCCGRKIVINENSDLEQGVLTLRYGVAIFAGVCLVAAVTTWMN